MVPLHHRPLDIPEQTLRLGDDGIVPRDHDHRHSEVSCDEGVEARFGNQGAIDAHRRVVGTGESVRSHPPKLVVLA